VIVRVRIDTAVPHSRRLTDRALDVHAASPSAVALFSQPRRAIDDVCDNEADFDADDDDEDAPPRKRRKSDPRIVQDACSGGKLKRGMSKGKLKRRMRGNRH